MRKVRTVLLAALVAGGSVAAGWPAMASAQDRGPGFDPRGSADRPPPPPGGGQWRGGDARPGPDRGPDDRSAPGSDGFRFGGGRDDNRRGPDPRGYDRPAPDRPGFSDRRGPDGRSGWDDRRGPGDRPGYAGRPGWNDRPGYRGDAGPGRGWRPGYDWRADRAYDWRGYRDRNRAAFRVGRYDAPRGWRYGYRRFSIGHRLPGALFASGYWLDDPWAYRLPAAYGPYHWVRYYGDVLLVDVRTGEIVDSVPDFFF